MNRTISLPEELWKKAEELAARERLQVEEFLCAKLSEQFAGLEYLQQRADLASNENFRSALRSIPDVEPEEYDRF
jgi:predicted DNA-binding ribbon-helix-helix protein